jgi:adenylate cyclase
MTEPAHILIVDDDPNSRRMLQLLFSGAGYRVSTAGSGEEALAYLDLVNPDLILMDLVLPGMSGQEVTARLKADPQRPFIPIILITGQAGPEHKITGLDAGADDFVVKPVEVGELLARARVMLRLQRSQRSLRAEQRKTELLLHLSRHLNASLDLDELLTEFLDELTDAVGAVRASIVLTIEEPPRFYSSTRAVPTIPLDDLLRGGIVGWALRERQPALVRDTREDPRWIAGGAQHLVRSAAAVPIIREERVLGAITLVHHTPGYFTDEHLDLLGSIAAQSAIALENAALFRLTRTQKELLERRNRELERINQVSQHLTELMRPDQLLRLVTHLVQHTFGYPLVTALLHEGEDLVVRAVAGSIDLASGIGVRVPAGRGIVGWAAARREPVNVPDVRRDERFFPTISPSRTRSELAVPIMTAREVFGVLAVMSPTEAAFDANDIRLLGTLAGQLGIALDNARLFEAEKRRVRQLDQVNNLSVALTAQLDVADTMRIAAEAIAAIFGIERCAVVLAGEARLPEEADTRPSFAVAARAVAGAVRLREPALIPAVTAEERLAALRPMLDAAGIDALALAPLLAGNRNAGMIVIDASGRHDAFGYGELALLETIASLIGQVVENTRLYQQVEDERRTLNAVLDGAADPILLVGPDDRLLLANRAAGERLALDAAAGQPLSALAQHGALAAALHRSNGADRHTAPPEITLPAGETFSVSVAPVRGADGKLLGRVAVLQNITAIKELERREQERIRSIFQRYVSPEVVEQVLAGGFAFGEPVERDVVVVFTDLRDYTALTEGLAPQVLVERVLNRYFTVVTEVLHRYEGTVDKFMGDGMLGVFGTPIAHADDPARSLLAAVDIQRAFAALRAQWQAELGFSIGMGVGVACGRAVVGNIGSARRLDYTVIGDVVNTANRLCGVARAGQVIVSYHVVESLDPRWTPPWPLRPLDRVLLKGKTEPHQIYEVAYASASGSG